MTKTQEKDAVRRSRSTVRSSARWWLMALAVAAAGSSANAYVQDFSAVGGGYTANYSIYVPPAAETPRIKAVVFLYGGSGGDWRYRVKDPIWQDAARSLGVALIGVDAYGYSAIGSNHTQAEASLNTILSNAASVTGRSELVNVPLMSTGTSLGGFSSTKWAYHLPERTIAIAAQRGADYFSAPSSGERLDVHTLVIPGSIDTNGITNPPSLRNEYDLWRSGSTDGRAAWAVDWEAGHDTFGSNQTWALTWTWLAESMAMRYPQNALPSTTPGNAVTLNDVTLTQGWLGQQAFATSTTGADRSSFVNIAPYSSYAGDKGLASWLPNETVARVYQAFNSFDGNTSRTAIPLQGPLAIIGDAAPLASVPNQTDVPQLATWTVGSTINITVDPREFDDSKSIVRMEYYDGATLLGVQTSASGSTWNLPYTLNTKGIHSLTVVATDSLGNKTSAFRTVVASPTKNTSTSHWRFEAQPGLKTDQYDNNNLAEASNTNNRPVWTAKPTSGAGSKFMDFGFDYGDNDGALKFQASKSQYIVANDTAMFSSGANGRFTFEALVNLSSTDAGGSARAIAAQGGYNPTVMGWMLMVTSETSGRGARNLIFQFTQDGKGGSSGNMDTIDSDLQLALGVDYYMALAFNPADTSSSGATFYLKDLTHDGPLQIIQRSHVFNSLFDSGLMFTLGSGHYNTYWDGLIDEARFSNRLLSQSDLLISQIPEPAGLLTLMAIGGLMLGRRNRA